MQGLVGLPRHAELAEHLVPAGAEAVLLARGSDKSISVLAADLGVSPEALRHWLRGSNVEDDGSVINHWIIHPDYMSTAANTAAAPIWFCVTMPLRLS